MKVALSYDALIERNYSVELLELLCEIFPEADIYSFVHCQGKILGHIELRRIYSSYLSHWVRSIPQFQRWKFLVPTMMKTFSVPDDVDLLVSLSTGLAHGIGHGSRTRHICYLYSFEQDDHGWPGSFFSAYLREWQRKNLENSDALIFSSQSLKQRVLDLQGAAHVQTSGFAKKIMKVIPPVFNAKDYPLLPQNLKENKEFTSDYYVLNGNGEGPSKEFTLKLVQLLQEQKIKLKIVGEGGCVVRLRKELEHFDKGLLEFWGNPCSGELSPLLSGARALLCFSSNQAFPHMALAALASGRPFIVADIPENREFLPSEGGFFIQFPDTSALRQKLQKMDNEYSWFDAKVLRRSALKFQDMMFRQEFKKVFQELLALGSGSRVDGF